MSRKNIIVKVIITPGESFAEGSLGAANYTDETVIVTFQRVPLKKKKIKELCQNTNN